MEQNIFLLILIFLPLSLFIGFGASAIGLTAWPLVVPLLFVLFGFDLYLTIFISLLIDSGNAFMKSLSALKNNQIDVGKGLRFAFFACLCIIPGIWVGTRFIPQHTDFFRGSVGYFNLLFGIGFIMRGFKKSKEGSNGNEGSDIQDQNDNGSEKKREKISGDLKKYAIWPGIAYVAIQTGLIGIGGGMMYAVFIMAFLSFPTQKATGTAMLISFCSAAIASIAIFIQIPQTAMLNQSMVILIAMLIIISMIGTVVGEKITHSLSEQRINYIIGGVIIASSILVSAQGVVIG